ncbi:hypothetical protein EXIGLDRAFT_629844, partial [Exidia glandulosa HHB12029]
MPIGEYNHCDLFPGLFPTLFPLGVGGLEDRARQRQSIGFQTHASYLLDLGDRSFSQHRSFNFIVVNILQRRAVHLETRFRMRTSHLEKITPDLLKISGEQIHRVATHLERGGKMNDLGPEDKSVFDLLKVVEIVAAKVPGSYMAKLTLRKHIFSYMRHFGLPLIYFTANPNPVHSPMFHLMFGDVQVDLGKRYPFVAAAYERSLRVSQDPAIAADFFDLSIRLMFEHLFGWDFDRKCSTDRGGILGHLLAFVGSVE